jgi:hypothetical protein
MRRPGPQALGLWALVILGACAPASAERAPASFVTPLVTPQGERLEPLTLFARARWTVLVFYSPTCHCVAAHEPRLAGLQAKYQGLGVRFFWVDSEVGASEARDTAETRRRGLTFPILLDPGAQAARRLDARFAGDALVIDAGGAVHYHGGIDSDRDHLRDDAAPYLQNALDDLLAGREPRVPSGPALGCSLQTW